MYFEDKPERGNEISWSDAVTILAGEFPDVLWARYDDELTAYLASQVGPGRLNSVGGGV